MKLIITDIENFNIPVKGEYKLIKPQGDIRHCIGCFGCWVKTPGQCVIHDGYENTGADMGKCSELILISKCCYGSVSPFVKNVQDRAISYIHPDFVIRKGEMQIISIVIKIFFIITPYLTQAKFVHNHNFHLQIFQNHLALALSLVMFFRDPSCIV